MPLELTKNFEKTIVSTYGSEGKRWLDGLPELLEKCSTYWNVTVDQSLYHLSYNYITTVRKNDDTVAVLKIGYPEEKELFTEMAALRFFDGNFTVRLLDENADLGAMLLEKIKPGTTLKTIQKNNDAEASQIAAPIIRDIPIDVPDHHSFPTVADWIKVLQRIRDKIKNTSITSTMLDRAQDFFLQLEETKTEDKLLHGDLHHDNILFDDQRGWIAIDPKGVVGDPAFHGARFIQNFWDTTPTESLVKNRIETIAYAQRFDSQRIGKWAYVDFIISNCWSLEENQDHEIDKDFLNALDSIIE